MDIEDNFNRVTRAYSTRAAEYIALLGSIEAAADVDRQLVATWAESVRGPIIDVGSGPGQWTDYLRQLGREVEGVEPVPDFVDDASRRYPDSSYRAGRAEQLGVGDGSAGGILSWFSLIHTEPDRIDLVFAEFARALRPGGGLLIGFFEGPELEPFDHAVTTAYFWPVDALTAVVERSGFSVTETRARDVPGQRRQGSITAISPDEPDSVRYQIVSVRCIVSEC